MVAIAKAASAISGTGTFQLGDEELVPMSANKIHQVAASPVVEMPEKNDAPARIGRPTQPLGSAPEPIATAASSPKTMGLPRAKMKPAADRTEELGASDLVALAPETRRIPHKSNPSPLPANAAPRPAAPPTARPISPPAAQPVASEAPKARPAWEHTQLPSSGAPLPALQPMAQSSSPAPARTPAPTALVPMPLTAEPAASSGVGGIVMIVAAVLVASLILGGAFWYRAHQEQVRHEQEIDERLRDLRQ